MQHHCLLPGDRGDDSMVTIITLSYSILTRCNRRVDDEWSEDSTLFGGGANADGKAGDGKEDDADNGADLGTNGCGFRGVG